MIKGGRTKKVSVTLPADLIAEVRAHVDTGEFSSFCADALRNYLAYYRQSGALKKGFGIWKDENHPELVTSRDVTRYVRKLRKQDGDRLSRLVSK